MTDEIRQEALNQLELDIKFGFENEEELFESIRDMFYDVDDFDEDWLKQMIADKYQQHQKDSLGWIRPTDFDRLANIFDELIKEKIVCLHNAGYTKQDGQGDCMETVEQLTELGIKASGYCYYHTQDLERAIDPEIKNLYLGFDSVIQDDNEALQVGNKIVDKLRKNGFEVSWPGTIDQRIEIKHMDWKKTPDNEKWGGQRVIQILTTPTKEKKPFWKFW